MKDLFEIKKLLLANNFTEVKENEFELNDCTVIFNNNSHKFVSVEYRTSKDITFDYMVQRFELNHLRQNTPKNCMYWLIGVLLKEKIVETLNLD